MSTWGSHKKMGRGRGGYVGKGERSYNLRREEGGICLIFGHGSESRFVTRKKNFLLMKPLLKSGGGDAPEKRGDLETGVLVTRGKRGTTLRRGLAFEKVEDGMERRN